MAVTINGSTGITSVNGSAAAPSVTGADTDTGIVYGTNTLSLATGGTTAVTVDSSQNVGIGTSSPSNAKLNSIGADTAPQLNLYSSSSGSLGANFTYKTSSGDLYIATNGYNSSSAPQMVLSASGNLLVGTTSNVAAPARSVAIGTSTYGALAAEAPGSGGGYPVWFRDTDATSGSQQMVHFRRGASNVGSITTTNTATAYNTSSDYRLKEQVQPMTGSLSIVQQLKPCTYKWKADDSDGQGFIAHELQAVMPDAVTGEKDAVDADGNPQYQGIDTSFLVATLTAAIQEQQALITQLQADVAALKAPQ